MDTIAKTETEDARSRSRGGGVTGTVLRFPAMAAGNGVDLAIDIDRVVVIDDYSLARGGATGLALLSVTLLRQRGIAVSYLCGDSGENAALIASGVEIHALGGQDLLNANKLTALTNGFHNRAAARMITDWIKAHDTPKTAYHVHGWSKILSPAVFNALDPVAERTVVHAHDFFNACPNGAFYDYQHREVCERQPLGLDCLTTACDKRSYTHKLWRSARGFNLFHQLRSRGKFSRIVLLHEAMEAFFLRAGYAADRLVTLRNPTTPFRSRRVAAERNQEFFFIGRLDEEKGVEDAAAAARIAGLPLTIIGDGPLREKLAREPQTRMLGWLNQAQIGSVIGSARALIMPSRYPEPFGMVALEAAASGLPVILSKTAFLGEELQRAGAGLTCDMRDPSEIARAMKFIAAMPEDGLRLMSEAAFETAPRLSTTRDGWGAALIEQYHDILTAVPGNRHGQA